MEVGGGGDFWSGSWGWFWHCGMSGNQKKNGSEIKTYKPTSPTEVAVVLWIWCPPSDREVTGSIPTVGAFFRSPPKTPKHRLAGADRSSLFFLKVKGLSFSITKEGGVE
ncbi:hypothetical protein DPMN_144057 [Dreissena polymorpha]|uniref:Uncharacterized protein n=1 Tax=Dreissena polymorpha TaxID=45954 RepID=A0A9D4GE98_DREPO|nr:hypothetical protein DPMN_144057 [Dreissena polymorpha]